MVYIPLIFFTTYFIYTYKRNKTIFNIGEIITLFYIVSSLFSVIIVKGDLWQQSNYGQLPKMGIIPTILYCVLITICIEPFSRLQFSDISIRGFESKNKTFKIVCWVLIILNMMFLIWDFSHVLTTLRGNLQSIRSLYYSAGADLRKPWYIMPSYYAKQFSPIILLFFFFSLLFEENSKFFSTMLLVSSAVYPISSIVNASRTEVVDWIMTAVVLYMIFYKKMSKQNRRFVLTFMIIVGAVALIYLILVTVSRFSFRSYGTKGGLILYIGQPYLQFCKIYDHYTFDGQLHFERTFPILCSIFNGRFDFEAYRNYQSLRIGAETGVFLTFLGDAMLDFGKIGMIIYALAINWISRVTIKRYNRQDLTLSTLIILTLLFRIPLLGIFDDVYLAVNTSIMLVGSVILALLFSKVKFTINSRRNF